jgi:hypothetical protein
VFDLDLYGCDVVYGCDVANGCDVVYGCDVANGCDVVNIVILYGFACLNECVDLNVNMDVLHIM